MVQIKKIITTSTISLILLSGTVYADEHTTTNIENVAEDLQIIEDAGYTPDNTIMHNFDRFGDWSRLQFSKLGGDEEYDKIENEVLQERLAELKLVNEDKRLEFKEKIQEQIEDRKERKLQKIEEIKSEIENRKSEKRDLNETDSSNDEELNELEKLIGEIETDIDKDDDEIRKKLKSVEFDRDIELAKLQEKFEKHQLEVRELNRNSDDFIEENKELFQKYGSLIEEFEGDSFKISTDKRELIGEIRDGKVNFLDDMKDVDYKLYVRSEDELKESYKSGNTNLESIEKNVDIPLKLKTKVAYNIVTNDD